MIGYWLSWSLLTMFKVGLLVGFAAGAAGGVLHFGEYGLLAIIFVPASIWSVCDLVYQIRVPLVGGRGNQLHKPSDTPMYMGLAPSYREAKEIIRKGHCIIWD